MIPDTRGIWAALGAMHLTGRADGPPLVAPAEIVERIVDLGRTSGVDPFDLIVERARAAGLHRGGATSCGGVTRLLPCADGWIACTLARPEDRDLLPAWFGEEIGPRADPWAVVEALAGDRTATDLVDSAALLGLAVARPGETDPGPEPVRRFPLGTTAGRRHARPFVIDLSSLWAGPLCARLLADRGAEVVKVESSARPDGARQGPARFYDRLHGGIEAVALDFRTDAGRAALHELLGVADVVIESSRPRALEQLGINAARIAGEGPTVWVSITGHGRERTARDRIGFGDDAAVAGGLVAWDEQGPCFVADAIADPLAGMAAAVAAVEAIDRGGGWLLDVALARVAAHVAGPHAEAARVRWTAGRPEEATRLGHPPAVPRAPALGEHTDAVLTRLHIGR